MSVAQCAIALGLELWTIYSLEPKSNMRQALLGGSGRESTVNNGVPAGICEAAASKPKANGKAL